jgi:hypothetical protein
MGAWLETLLQQRILVLDGAMGTMIQQRKLDEAAFRGERFKDCGKAQKGLNDLLNLTQPAIIEEIHRQYFEAGADIVVVGLRDCESRSGMRQARCGAGQAGSAGPVLFCGWSNWADDEDLVDFNRCEQSCGARHHL